MNCIVCKTPFSASETEMIQRDNDINLCDYCALDEMEIHVKYDGADDYLAFLKKEVPTKGICVSCRDGKVELLSIIFGNPIKGHIKCTNCKLEDTVYIYMEMV